MHPDGWHQTRTSAISWNEANVDDRHSVLEAAQDKYDEDSTEERPDTKDSGSRRVIKREILVGHNGKKPLV